MHPSNNILCTPAEDYVVPEKDFEFYSDEEFSEDSDYLEEFETSEYSSEEDSEEELSDEEFFNRRDLVECKYYEKNDDFSYYERMFFAPYTFSYQNATLPNEDWTMEADFRYNKLFGFGVVF